LGLQDVTSRRAAESCLTELQAEFAPQGERGFELTQLAGGWAFRTNPLSAGAVKALFELPAEVSSLSPAAMECLAIIAYLQPVSRPQIAEIRGVNSDSPIRGLLDRELIADVGLVGAPNAGKSTLISVVSAAHPKIADYPFTTKTPVLGIVKTRDFDSFVMVDIPGLIEGAHQGKGMGKEFLRHVERCRVILYLVDVASPDPAADYHMLKNELLHYDPVLLERPSILVLTKCDLIENGISGVDQSLLAMHERTVPISALTKAGLGSLLEHIVNVLA